MAKRTDLERRLKELDGLRERGVITEQEHQARRTAVMNEPSATVSKQGGGCLRTGAIIAGAGIVLLIIIVAVVAVAGGGSDDKDAPTLGSAGEPASGEGVASIGQPVRLDKDGWVITVTGTRTTPTVKGITGDKTALGIYLIVDLTMENIEKTARELGGDRFTIRDSQNREYKFYSEGTIGNGRGEISSKINPGLTGRGTLVFDVPKDATGLMLETVGKGKIALGDLPAGQ